MFTGGVGEHAPPVRDAVATRLAYLGVGVDPAANEAAATDAVISHADSSVATVVVAAREDVEIAGQVRHVLALR